MREKKMFKKYFFFKGVTNKARLAMVFNLIKNYVKELLIKIKFL